MGIADIIKKRKQTETIEAPSGDTWTVKRLSTKDTLEMNDKLFSYTNQNEQLGYLLYKCFVSAKVDGTVILQAPEDSEQDYIDQVADMDAEDGITLYLRFMQMWGLTEEVMKRAMANPDFRDQMRSSAKKK